MHFDKCSSQGLRVLVVGMNFNCFAKQSYTQWCIPTIVRLWLAGLIPPPSKRTHQEDEDNDLGKEAEDYDAPEGSLVPFSESAAAFLEIVLSSKLNNNSQKAKANGTPDWRWIQCA